MKSKVTHTLPAKNIRDEYSLQITVKSITKGKCSRQHQLGETWFINEGKTPEGICLTAFYTMFPAIRLLRLGGEHHWDKDRDVTYVSCPDHKHQVIFEVKRLPKG